jgi:hypothetical protein
MVIKENLAGVAFFFDTVFMQVSCRLQVADEKNMSETCMKTTSKRHENDIPK